MECGSCGHEYSNFSKRASGRSSSSRRGGGGVGHGTLVLWFGW